MTADASVILVSEDGWTVLEPDLLAEREGSASCFHKPWWKSVTFFHRNGTRYEVASATPLRPLPPLSKVLAATVHNPKIVVRYEYRPAGAYTIDDLKVALSEAIYRDPDVMTQFHAGDELMMRLGGSASFDDIVGVVHYAATDES
jgi:hypothetical protein